MAPLGAYREIIKSILTEYTKIPYANPARYALCEEPLPWIVY